MASYRAWFLLVVALVALFTQTYASLYYPINNGDEIIAYHRARRSPNHHGVTGPVHTFVKTDKHANFKWGVRHHVGHRYSGN